MLLALEVYCKNVFLKFLDGVRILETLIDVGQNLREKSFSL